jgi:hypothetical protein
LFWDEIGVGLPNFETFGYKMSQKTGKINLPETMNDKKIFEKLFTDLFDDKNKEIIQSRGDESKIDVPLHSSGQNEERCVVNQNEITTNDFGVKIYKYENGTLGMAPYYIEAKYEKKAKYKNFMQSDLAISVDFKQYKFSMKNMKVNEAKSYLSSKTSENSNN